MIWYSNILLFRPYASSGWWLGCLLAIAYAVGYWKHKHSATFEYKLSTIIAAGLTLETATIYLGLRTTRKSMQWFLMNAAPVVLSGLIFYCLNQGLFAICISSSLAHFYEANDRHEIVLSDIWFSLFSGYSTTFVYHRLYTLTLRKLPKSFTYGEASIVVQGSTIFAYNVFLKLAMLYYDSILHCSTDSEVCSATNSDSHGFWISNIHKQMSITTKLSTVLQVFWWNVCAFSTQ